MRIGNQLIADANNKPIPSYLSVNIPTQATTLVKTGTGILHTLDFTATIAGVITIYDGLDASGIKLRTITSPGTLLQSEVNKVLDLVFSTGLTIVTSGANQDIVVSYI